MFYRVGDLDDLQTYLHVSLHVGFKIQFTGIVPVLLEFNGGALPAADHTLTGAQNYSNISKFQIKNFASVQTQIAQPQLQD